MKPVRILALILALAMLCLSLTACGEDRIIRNARYGVVRVIAVRYGADGVTVIGGGTGTAFGVGKSGKDTDTFVTNWHVVTNKGEGADEVFLLLDSNAFIETANGYVLGDSAIPCEILMMADKYPDVAIIRAKQPVSGLKALPLQKSEEAKVAQTVHALGFPGAVDTDAIDFENMEVVYRANVEDVVVTDGQVSRFSTLKLSGNTDSIMHSAHINQGNSGGPLITDNGTVVGINTYGNPEDSNYSYSIYIDYAMDMLDQLGIQYDVQTAAGIMLKNYGIPAVGIAVLVAALIAVLVVALKRKDTDDGGVTYTIQATGGDMFGRSWKIGAAPITLGRGGDCTVRFGPSSKGISRAHASVEVKDGAVILTDLNSSYGTFANGRRLAAGASVEIKPGESFYLANEIQSFTVQSIN